jgi:hypothetical protein
MITNNRDSKYQLGRWVALILLSAIIISCSVKNSQSIAYDISTKSQLRSTEIKGGKFVLRVYYRFEKPGAALKIYLEGDGRSWLTPSRASYNPTPRNPVGLELAAQDDADNVMYIARPCQYVSFKKNPNCKYPYWTHKRFAPEVIDSVIAVMDRGKKMAKARGIELIGFSGGGAVAILASAKRDDVIGIRTVAGNLNHEIWTNLHKVDPLNGSLNAVDMAIKVRNIPQLHYVGKQDTNIVRLVADSFKDRSGPGACLKIKEVLGAGHTVGWVKLWRKLYKIKLPYCPK